MLTVMGMLGALGKMNLVSGNLFWERHCSAREDLNGGCQGIYRVVVAGYALTILRRYYGVSDVCSCRQDRGGWRFTCLRDRGRQ
jgi:hypothetical protein